MESTNVESETNTGATSSTAPPGVRPFVVQSLSIEESPGRSAQILRTDRRDRLPDSFNSTQVALAHGLGIGMRLVGEVSRPRGSDFFDQYKDARSGLKELAALLHYYELQQSMKAVDDAGTNATLQGQLLVPVARSLQRYCESPACGDMINITLIIHAVDSEAALEPSARNPDVVRASVKWLIAPIRNIIIAIVNLTIATSTSTYSSLFSPSGADAEAIVDTIVDVLARQIVALLGGLCLVVPLIVMTFLTSVGARLAIVCYCVFNFSFFIGVATRASNQEVLGAAAAYAAVLVVFVGTSS